MKIIARGYSLIEVVIYIALVVVVGGITAALTTQMILAVGRARASSVAVDGARRAIEVMTREIVEADLVYANSTGVNQLSIRTSKGLNEDSVLPYVYVDYFVVDGVLYRHQQGEVYPISSDTMNVVSLTPTILYDGEAVSVAVTTEFNTDRSDLREQSAVTLHSTITTRSYAND